MTPQYEPLAATARRAFSAQYPNHQWNDLPWSMKRSWMQFVLEAPTIALRKEK